MLRLLRILLATALFSVLTFYFLDFAKILPEETSWLARIQLVPSIMAHRWEFVAAILVGTLLLGRFYCSMICPLGILQDLISRAVKLIRPKRKFGFRKPIRLMRTFFLTVFCVVAAVVGPTFALILFDPYSNFGSIADNIFKPIYVHANNLLSNLCVGYNVFWFYQVNPTVRTIEAFFVALAALIIVGVLAAWNGRTYCNTICPVGTVLGWLSRISFFRIHIDPYKCVSCGLCAQKCKASCIDNKGKVVDNSRCVDCFDCLYDCRFGAISLFPLAATKSQPKSKSGEGSDKNSNKDSSNNSQKITKNDTASTASTISAADTISTASTANMSNTAKDVSTSEPAVGRRVFVGTLLTIAAAAPKAVAEEMEAVYVGKTPFERKTPIAPPGALSIGHLNAHCTSCHLCVAKCPPHVLKPAVFEYGLKGFLQPYMEFSRGFCNFDCTICSDVCPNGALLPLTQEQKHMTQVGRVVFIEDNCVVKVNKTSCGACSEHCPTQAVAMVPYENGLTIPKINPDICVGCGGCESICPARPFRAIYVEGNAVHKDREEFQETETKEVENVDFGF